MKDLAAVIIDTYPNKGLAASAIHMALRMPNCAAPPELADHDSRPVGKREPAAG